MLSTLMNNYTKIIEVKLFAFAYRLFHEDFLFNRRDIAWFDATCLLYGGLNHVMFLFLLFFCLLFLVVNVCGCCLVLQFVVISTTEQPGFESG